MLNTKTFNQQSNTWTPNSTLRRYMSSDISPNFNKQYYINNNLNNFNGQFQKPVGVLDQMINRTIPTPPPRLSSAKNTLRRRSYVENLINIIEQPTKPIRQKIQNRLNQSQFDIPGTPIITHLPPQTLNRFTQNGSTNFSSINLTQPFNLNQPNQSTVNNSRANLDNQVQPFYNKTMSLDNLHAVALRQNLRRSPTREELFDYIIQQQEQLAEIKTQQKVLEKQVDLAHKEASKAHHHHHHKHHRHHKSKSKDRDNLDNSIDSSSMISSDRKQDRKHHKSKLNKNLTVEANKQVHDHIKQLQEQLELIRQKRRKIKTDKNVDGDIDEMNQQLDKSIDQSLLYNVNRKLNAKDWSKNKNELDVTNNLINEQNQNNNFLKLPGQSRENENNLNTDSNILEESHDNLLSPAPTPLSNRSPLGSRSSSIERAIAKRELLKESAKGKKL